MDSVRVSATLAILGSMSTIDERGTKYVNGHHIGNRRSPPVRLLRFTIYSEVAIIVATVALGVVDGTRLTPLVLLLRPLVYVGLFSLFLAPIVLIVLAFGEGLSIWQRMAAIILAIILPIAHFLAIFPLVS